jgi:AcrR family transcriptional regulator
MTRSADYEGRRAQIIQAAMQVFARSGLQATNKEIADLAGVTPPAIYWYFPSKQNLFQAVLAQGLGHSAAITANLPKQVDDPPEAVLIRFAEQFVAAAGRSPIREILRLTFMESGSHPEMVKKVMDEFVQGVLRGVEAYFGPLVEKQLFRQVPPSALAYSFMGPLLTAVILGQVVGRSHLPGDSQLYVRWHVQSFLYGARNTR